MQASVRQFEPENVGAVDDPDSAPLRRGIFTVDESLAATQKERIRA